MYIYIYTSCETVACKSVRSQKGHTVFADFLKPMAQGLQMARLQKPGMCGKSGLHKPTRARQKKVASWRFELVFAASELQRSFGDLGAKHCQKALQMKSSLQAIYVSSLLCTNETNKTGHQSSSSIFSGHHSHSHQLILRPRRQPRLSFVPKSLPPPKGDMAGAFDVASAERLTSPVERCLATGHCLTSPGKAMKRSQLLQRAMRPWQLSRHLAGGVR